MAEYTPPPQAAGHACIPDRPRHAEQAPRERVRSRVPPMKPTMAMSHGRKRLVIPWSRLIVPLLLVACLLSPGCVRRRMTIRSNPDGATVYVDDQEIGTTPVSASYNYYGTRKIQLVRDGYETLTVMHKFQQPWYQFPPLDFVTENLLPREVRDEQIVDIELEPQCVVPTPELLNRAQQLRQSTRQGYTVLPPPSPSAPDGPTSSTGPSPAALAYPPPFYPSTP